MLDPLGYFRDMARNNAWSNHRLLEACARLSQDELEARRTSFFPSIKLTLNHLLIIDWYYLDGLEGGGRGRATLADEVPCATAAALTQAQRTCDARLIAFCDALDEARLQTTVLLDGDATIDTRVEQVGRVLQHLFVHQIHHRGQVHAMLAGTSVAPPQLDEFFLACDAPRRAREMAALGFREAPEL